VRRYASEISLWLGLIGLLIPLVVSHTPSSAESTVGPQPTGASEGAASQVGPRSSS
jgi:hypothetical protein